MQGRIVRHGESAFCLCVARRQEGMTIRPCKNKFYR